MKRVLSILLALLLCAALLPAAAFADSTKTVYVSSTGSGTLNLRAGPGKSYASNGYVKHGAKVSVLDTSGEWSKVKVSSSGKTGWIKTKYIDGTTKDLGSGTKTVKTGGDSLNLRSGPGTSYSKKGSVKNGATVKVLNTEDDWVKVTDQSTGKTGWIMAKYIGAASSSSSGSKSSSSSSSSGTAVRHVTATSLNVRKGAGASYGKVTVLGKGEAFKVTGSSGNWYKITTFDGVSGWVSKSYTASGATAKVTASSLNIRASANGKILGSAASGATATVDKISGSWAHVTIGKTTGWVAVKYLKF